MLAGLEVGGEQPKVESASPFARMVVIAWTFRANEAQPAHNFVSAECLCSNMMVSIDENRSC